MYCVISKIYQNNQQQPQSYFIKIYTTQLINSRIWDLSFIIKGFLLLVVL